MIWYLAFAGMFLAYQLDLIFYTLVAAMAAAYEALYPPPGHPAYSRWHPHDALVEPPDDCDEQGYRLPSAAACSYAGKQVPSAADAALGVAVISSGGAAASSMHRAHGWQITATPAPPSSAADSSSVSNCSSSVASGSHPSTPTMGHGRGSAGQHSPKAVMWRLAAGNAAAAAESGGGGGGGSALPPPPPPPPALQKARDMLALPFPASSIAATVGSRPAVGNKQQGTLLPASLVACYNRFPLVLVQLPMYNEEAHCEAVIDRACSMAWTRSRLVVQVCDDSTSPAVKARIDAKAAEMCARGHSCLVARRPANVGYKAGNMLNGLAQLSKLPYEYVAVFDADFEMPPDFLHQTIHHMMADEQLGFVQARWTFTNTYENVLTWCQAISLALHFAVEQRARSALHTFFGFNGTAGVWRRKAMEQAGGWSIDSTVEDMDLSLRAYLCGWKFKYLHWVACPNELPPTLSAYKTQQYRWNSGPMVIVKSLLRAIWAAPGVTLMDRLSMSYFFFRFIYSAFLTVVCLLCPAVVIWLDPWQWSWPNILFLVSGNASAATLMWFAGPLFVPYLLLQTGLGYFRVAAMLSGLLGSSKAGTWKVTRKFGRGGTGATARERHRPYALELCLCVVFVGYAAAAVLVARAYVLAAWCAIMAGTLAVICVGDHLF